MFQTNQAYVEEKLRELRLEAQHTHELALLRAAQVDRAAPRRAPARAVLHGLGSALVAIGGRLLCAAESSERPAQSHSQIS